MHEDFTPFADIKLSGGRYDQLGLPVSSVPELERYERIVIEVAKDLWKAAHSDRQRLPTRFGERLGLRLRAIDPGSVVPLLERSSDALELEDLFDRARDRVDDEFAKIVAGSWDDVRLPPRAMTTLKRFGVTLQEGEAFVFRASSDNSVRYDQSTRRRYLSRESGTNVEQEGPLFGIVHALDAEQTFKFSLSGRTAGIPGTFTDPEIFHDLNRALSNWSTSHYRLACTYLVNAESDVVQITDVTDVEVFLSSDDTGGERLRALAQLPPGWDGTGAREIAVGALEFARDLTSAAFAEGIRTPQIYPTLSGGIQLEWHGPDRHTEVEILPGDLLVECYHLGPSGERHDDIRGVANAVRFLKGVEP